MDPLLRMMKYTTKKKTDTSVANHLSNPTVAYSLVNYGKEGDYHIAMIYSEDSKK
jgi:hypothetical protein